MAANVFDHPWILLIIAAISLVRWLIQKSKTEEQDTETPPASPPNQPITRGSETRTEEERIRKFLEALGQPAGSSPPPKVTPRQRRPAPTIFSPLPPLTTAPPPLPQTTKAAPRMPPPLPPVFAPTPFPAASEADFEVRELTRQASSEPVPDARRAAGSQFATRLKLGTPQDLRTAIVLREIFGPPRSLQPLDLTSSS
jgi:hypothetical protein